MSYRASNLPADKHCFFGREGGVSEGLYASLNTNLKSRDKRENVLKNLAVIAARFGSKYDNMYTMKQGVSAQVVYVEKAAHFEVFADGVVTNKPDILLCLKTADCAPVLLADYQNGVIGAAHAGWRGAYKGVAENVVNLMLPPPSVRAFSRFLLKSGTICVRKSAQVLPTVRNSLLPARIKRISNLI